IRNLRKVIPAKLLLLFETKWAVIGGNDLQVVALEPIPKFFLVPFLAQWGSENVLCPLKSRHVKILNRKEQVLGTGLGVDWQATVAGLAHFLKRVVAAQMHNVDWSSGHLRQGDGACRGLGFGGCWPREGMVLGRFFALGKRLLHDHVNGIAVF